MKSYPRTDKHTWTWPLSDHVRFTNLSSSTPTVCPYTVNENPSSLTFTDQVSFGPNYPNWKKRLAEGLPTTTTLTGVKTFVRSPVGSGSWYWNPPGTYCLNGAAYGTFTGRSLSFNDPGAAADSVASAKAKAKLLNSYLQAVNTWRGGNFLAEVRETIHMVLHPVKSIYDETWTFTKKVKRLGKVYERSPTKYGKALANAWLAYVFGIKPFVDDANDASKALEVLRTGGNAGDIVKLRGASRNQKVTVTPGISVTPIGGWAGPRWTSTKTVKTDYKVRYIGALKTAFDGAEFQAAQWGVSTSDILPAVWEAIPWSFLIDYFVNVQEMVDGLRLVNAVPYRLDLNVRNAGVVQIGTPVSGPLTPASYVNNMICGPAHSLVVRVSRSQLSDFPYVGFRFKFPNFPSLKWLNIAALAEQIRSSRPKFK